MYVTLSVSAVPVKVAEERFTASSFAPVASVTAASLDFNTTLPKEIVSPDLIVFASPAVTVVPL